MPKKLPTKFTSGAPAVDNPKVNDDLIDRVKITSNVYVDDGPQFTIDVQPDQRFTVEALTFHASKLYPELAQKSNPYITPSSFVGYNMALYHGMMLANDAYIRTEKSPYAREILADPLLSDLLHDILNLKVPYFMETILSGMPPFNFARRQGIELIPSYAGFDQDLDYGRFFPITMFFKAHDLSASTRTNADPNVLLSQWFDTQLTTDANYPYRYGQYVGACQDVNNTSTTYNSWLLDCFIRLINPVVGRSLTQRPMYARIPLTVQAEEPSENPYIYALGASPDNIHIVTTALKAISYEMEKELGATRTLGQFLDTMSGDNSSLHAYSKYALPTWHARPYRQWPHDGTGTLVAATTFATNTQFKIAPPYDNLDQRIRNANVQICQSDLCIASSQIFDAAQLPYKYELFDARRDIAPDVRYFNPYNTNTSQFFFTVVNGLIIESEELDAFGVPVPNFCSTLHECNSQVFQSAIPFEKIRKATSTTPVYVIARKPYDEYEQPVSVSLYDMTKNWLGRLTQGFRMSEYMAAFNNALSGFSIQNRIPFVSRLFSKFGYKLGEDAPIPAEFVIGWSTYRYVKSFTSDPRRNKFMLFNFRTIYGTEVTLVQSSHPSNLIPK